VPRLTESGKEVKFNEREGQIIDSQGEIIAIASKVGSLYYINSEHRQQGQRNA